MYWGRWIILHKRETTKPVYPSETYEIMHRLYCFNDQSIPQMPRRSPGPHRYSGTNQDIYPPHQESIVRDSIAWLGKPRAIKRCPMPFFVRRFRRFLVRITGRWCFHGQWFVAAIESLGLNIRRMEILHYVLPLVIHIAHFQYQS